MSGFTLRQLELIVGLEEHPTLSSAAAALHISESGLSHAISDLENLVGEQLCVRRKARGVQLTPAGAYFVRRARAILNDANALAGELADLDGRLKGPVSLGCYPGLANTVLPAILEGFPNEYPDVQLSISMGSSDEMLPRVISGELDVAVLYDLGLPAGLASHKIYDTEVMAILPEEHPLAARDAINLADLSGDPLILLDSAPSSANTLLMFSQQGLTPNISISVPQIELVRALVGRGLGYSLLMARPNWVPNTIEGRRINAIPLDPPAGVTSVVAAYSPSGVSRRAQALISYASKAFLTRQD